MADVAPGGRDGWKGWERGEDGEGERDGGQSQHKGG